MLLVRCYQHYMLYLKSDLITLDFAFDPLLASLWTQVICLSS
jgi:hypothetical protein